MGAGATTALNNKDDKLSQQEVQAVYGDEFDEYIFSTLQDEDGLVNRDDVKKLVQAKRHLIDATLTTATKAVFSHYASNTNEMKARQFCDMCRDAKLLHKKKFSNADANILYGVLLKKQKTPLKSLPYAVFKSSFVPAIAERHEIEDVDIILSKFGSIILPSEAIFDDVLREKEDNNMAITDDQKKAAVKIQALSRQKSAAKEIEELKQITTLIPDIKDDFFTHPTKGKEQLETKILDVFCTYCGDGVITKALLVKLLKEANLMQINTAQSRNVSGCKIAFTKALLLAKTRGCYKSGVIANKYLTYRVFREVLLPCVAERFGCPTEEILEALRRLPSANIEAMSAVGAGFRSLFIRGASQSEHSMRSPNCSFHEEVNE